MCAIISVQPKKVKSRSSHAELYKIIVEDNIIECIFPNGEIGFHIFLTLMVTNCSADRSLSQLKYIKKTNQNSNATRQAGCLISTRYRSRYAT